MNHRLIVLAAGAVLAVASTSALAGREKLNCEAPSNQTCYFTIYYSTGGYRNFTMRGGESDWISGVRPGDTYCKTVNQGIPNPDMCFRNPINGIE